MYPQGLQELKHFIFIGLRDSLAVDLISSILEPVHSDIGKFFSGQELASLGQKLMILCPFCNLRGTLLSSPYNFLIDPGYILLPCILIRLFIF